MRSGCLFACALHPHCLACDRPIPKEYRPGPHGAAFVTCDPPCGQSLYVHHLGEGAMLLVPLRPAEAEALGQRDAALGEVAETAGLLRAGEGPITLAESPRCPRCHRPVLDRARRLTPGSAVYLMCEQKVDVGYGERRKCAQRVYVRSVGESLWMILPLSKSQFERIDRTDGLLADVLDELEVLR